MPRAPQVANLAFGGSILTGEIDRLDEGLKQTKQFSQNSSIYGFARNGLTQTFTLE